ncbi:MAG: hypothetical protein K6E84_08115 [Lachnospiraceae bacterium]|nr:hypothetical protein [Lachnospiraceae bacterium]
MSQVTVYLSNTDVQVLLGSGTEKGLSVKHFYSMEVPEGSVLNGVITDGQSLIDALKHFWYRHKLPNKDIDLVVNTPQIKVRVPDVPLMSSGKTLEYLKREYIEREEEQILGFYRISRDKKSKTSKVCAEITDTEFLNSYLQVFSAAGISLSGVFSGVGSAINLFRKTGFAQSENCVILIRDGMTITAIFFVKGQYYYSTSTRVFSEAGTAEYGREVAKIINQIDQFSKSQKLEDPISTIYLAGMDSTDDSICSKAISDTLSNPVVVGELISLKGVNVTASGRPLDTLVYPAAGLIPRTDHINILKSIKKEKSEKQIRQEKIMKLYVPYLATALVMAIITFYMLFFSQSRKNYLKELEDYNTNPENKFAAIEYDMAAERVAILGQHYGGLKALEADLNSYPAAVSNVWSVIRQDAAGVGNAEITGYDAESGQLSFTTAFNDVTLLNEFINRLKSESIFSSVDYKGYTETGENADGTQWTALLSCTLSESAGRDVVPVIQADPSAAQSEEEETEVQQ